MDYFNHFQNENILKDELQRKNINGAEEKKCEQFTIHQIELYIQHQVVFKIYFKKFYDN